MQTPSLLFDFYFDEPERINSALYWIRSQMNPLMDDPYNQAPWPACLIRGRDDHAEIWIDEIHPCISPLRGRLAVQIRCRRICHIGIYTDVLQGGLCPP
jgi:hypothetical protein